MAHSSSSLDFDGKLPGKLDGGPSEISRVIVGVLDEDVIMRLSNWRIGLSIAVVGVVSGCVERGAPIEPIKVGLLVPNSGGLAGLGKSWESAARLAAEQINSSGGLFDGREIVLVIEDSQTDPGPAAAAAQALLDDGVVALIGPATSTESAAVKPLAEQANVPMISCCATSATLTDAQTDRKGWFFRTAPNDSFQAKALAYLAANGTRGPFEGFAGAGPGESLESCPELIVVAQDDVYGTKLADGLVAEYNGRPINTFDVADVATPLLKPDDTVAVGRVVSSQTFTPGFAIKKDPNDPDVIAAAALVVAPLLEAYEAASGHDFTWNPNTCFAIVAFGEDGAAVFVELHKRLVALESRIRTDTLDPRHDPAFILPREYYGPDGLNDPTFATNAGAFGPRVVGTVPTHAANNAYTKFDSAYRARFSTAPGNFTSQMFDAAMVLGLAITTAGDLDGTSIRDALFDVSEGGQVYDGNFYGEMAAALLRGDDIDYVGPSGEVDFNGGGDVIGDYALWRAVDNGSTYEIQETDFLPANVFLNLE